MDHLLYKNRPINVACVSFKLKVYGKIQCTTNKKKNKKNADYETWQIIKLLYSRWLSLFPKIKMLNGQSGIVYERQN